MSPNPFSCGCDDLAADAVAVAVVAVVAVVAGVAVAAAAAAAVAAFAAAAEPFFLLTSLHVPPCFEVLPREAYLSSLIVFSWAVTAGPLDFLLKLPPFALDDGCSSATLASAVIGTLFGLSSIRLF